MKQEKGKDLNWWSWLLIVLAILLISFSFIAPMLFTSESSSPRWDFRATGAIGDTMGGIMNPFIAIAGVIASFLAFYIQIRANKIQRNQFKQELDQREINEQFNHYYMLKLIEIDGRSILSDVENRVKNIERFVQENIDYPTQLHPVMRTSTKLYDRMLEMDRQSVFKGFKLFIRGRIFFESNSWVQEFNELYTTFDYLSEAFKIVYGTIDYHNKDIFDKKIVIKEEIEKLEIRLVELQHKNPGADYMDIIKAILKNWKDEVKESNDEHREVNINNVLPALKKYTDDLNNFLEQTGMDNELDNTSKQAAVIARRINEINFDVAHINSEMTSFISSTQKAKNDFKDVIDNIAASLNGITEREIQEGKFLYPDNADHAN